MHYDGKYRSSLISTLVFRPYIIILGPDSGDKNLSLSQSFSLYPWDEI